MAKPTEERCYATTGATVLEIDGHAAQSAPAPNHALNMFAQSGDEWAAGLVPTLDALESGALVLTSRIAPFATVAKNGDRLLDAISAACKDGRERFLKRLIWFFGGPTLRLPVVHTFLDGIKQRHGDGAIARFLGTAWNARGRPHALPAQMHALVLVQEIASKRGVSVRKAVDHVREICPGTRHCSPLTLQNLHSDYGELPRIYAEGYFVPSSRLRPFRWGSTPRQWTRFVPSSR